jgi:phenylpropionate dioxygenase-like ring-hydroxylating dioxygenase large terminal subunit
MSVTPFAASKKSASGGTDWPPSWNTMPHGISVGRYTDPGFARLEDEKLWSRVWQIASRLDEVPEPGDYTTYDIGARSVLIVRVDANTIKAYHNVCPHRGTALSPGGCGHFNNDKIICPFHGWRWDTSGRNEFVLEPQEFRGGKLTASDVALREVKHVVFAGFIFINFAADPVPSFDDYIAPIRQLLEDLAIAEMHNYWWKAIPVHSNWKVAQEAFFEGYHVPATHPQLEVAAAEVIYNGKPESEIEFAHKHIGTDAFARGHGRFYGKRTPMKGQVSDVKGNVDDDTLIEGMAARLNLLAVGMDAQVLPEDIEVIRSLKGRPIPAGSSLGGEYVKALYARAAAQGRPMPKPTPENIGFWGGELFIFPNFMILPQGGNAMMYRARPDGQDPDRCIFEIFSTKTYPAAVKPPRAVCQDLGNIPRMQKGLHSPGIRQTWLASEHEKIILNMHQEMDRYLRAE